MQKNQTYPQVLIVGGPTASGKSDFAAFLAAEMGGVVINADSLQLYREIPVLSGQPDDAAQNGVPHALYGVLPVSEQASVGKWLQMAVAAVDAAVQQGKRPILVGGTGLYIQAFIDGLSEMPDIDDGVRDKVRAMLAEKGPEFLHAELQRRDPIAAARITPADRQRLSRAMEVVLGTGRALSEFQGKKAKSHSYPCRVITLLPPRDYIYHRCEARFDAMLLHGALDEARLIESLDLPPDLTAIKAKGIPELRAHIRGEMTLDQAAAIAKTKTRQYAKRQYTWFRHQSKPDLMIEDALDLAAMQVHAPRAIELLNN